MNRAVGANPGGRGDMGRCPKLIETGPLARDHSLLAKQQNERREDATPGYTLTNSSCLSKRVKVSVRNTFWSE